MKFNKTVINLKTKQSATSITENTTLLKETIYTQRQMQSQFPDALITRSKSKFVANVTVHPKDEPAIITVKIKTIKTIIDPI
jgi:hypothetical protein